MPVEPKDVVEILPAATAGFPSYCHGNAYRLRFAGASDMVRVAAAGVNRRECRLNLDVTDAGWIGRKFNDFGDVVKSVEGTWQAGCDRVEELARELEREELPRPTVVRRRRVWDEFAGDEIDVDRWKAGEPFFRETTKVRASGPRVISLLAQLGANSHMESEAIFWRGALAVTLARIVEDAGYRSEISTFAMTPGAPQHVLTTCELKGAGDALDVSSLVNVTSGWFFRTVMFASWTAPGKALEDCLGSMLEYAPAKAVEYLAGNARPWVIANVYNKASAVALAKTYLAQLVAESK